MTRQILNKERAYHLILSTISDAGISDAGICPIVKISYDCNRLYFLPLEYDQYAFKICTLVKKGDEYITNVICPWTVGDLKTMIAAMKKDYNKEVNDDI